MHIYVLYYKIEAKQNPSSAAWKDRGSKANTDKM